MEPIPHVPSHRVRRVLTLVVAAAVLGTGGWFAYAHFTKPTPTTYTTAPAAKGQVLQAVTAAGTLKPVVEVQVGSQVSGRIKELLVDYNDPVKAGEVIARIDPAVFESQVAQARSRLVSANADLDRIKATTANAKAQYDRLAALVDSGAVSRSEVDAALADWKSSKAQVSSAAAAITEAKAALDQAKQNLAYTTIASPIDGVVISRSVDVGQTVAASLSAPTLFVIAGDLTKMEVHTSVAESDVGQLTEGMKVTFTVDAFPEQTFTGTVRQVRNEATTTSNVVTYDAVVEVSNPKLQLRPGMTANATFVIAERDDVLMVSAKALRYRPATAKRGGGSGTARLGASGASLGASGKRRGQSVWVLRDGQPVRVPVQTGLTDGDVVEITGGELQEGDEVITADSSQKTAAGAQNGGQNRTRMPRGPF